MTTTNQPRKKTKKELRRALRRRIARRMARQDGLITYAQARALGMTRRMIQGMLAAGEWTRRFEGVYANASAPDTDHQKLRAALLAAGDDAALSHDTAGALWDADGLSLLPIHLSVPVRRYLRLPGVIVHRSSDLDRTKTTTRKGLRVTNPMRTLVDIGASATLPVVARALDHFLSRRLVTWAGVKTELDSVARRGRTGVGILRLLLIEREGTRPTDSVLEGHLPRYLRKVGLDPLVPQHTVKDEAGRFVARVDFAVPDLKLAIELLGFAHHSDFASYSRDPSRRRKLAAAGWTVLEFTWHEMTKNPELVVREILAHTRRLRVAA